MRAAGYAYEGMGRAGSPFAALAETEERVAASVAGKAGDAPAENPGAGGAPGSKLRQ